MQDDGGLCITFNANFVELVKGLTFAICNGYGRIDTFPDFLLNGIQLLRIRVTVSKDEDELWDNTTQSHAEEHEALVEEKDMLIGNSVGKDCLEDRKCWQQPRRRR